MKKQNSDPLTRRICILAAIVTLAVLAAVFAVTAHKRASIAPVYQMKVAGLAAQTPAEAQAQCRAESGKFEVIEKKYKDVCWVWCENEDLFLVKTSAVQLVGDSKFKDFTAISFRDRHGNSREGYIVRIDKEGNELGRIALEKAEVYDFESVSMSIRESLRSGKLAFENAVYLWEKGSGEVLAVKPDSYETAADNIVTFADDGGRTRICYILDTKI